MDYTDVDYDKLLRKLNNFELCAHKYAIDGKIFSIDVSDFKYIMAITAKEVNKAWTFNDALEELQSVLIRIITERNVAIYDMTTLMTGQCCNLCAVEHCNNRGKTKMCTAFKWRGIKED